MKQARHLFWPKGCMESGHCVATIEREVAEVAGVDSVTARQDTRAVTISWDPETTDWVVIEGVMNEINYPPEA